MKVKPAFTKAQTKAIRVALKSYLGQDRCPRARAAQAALIELDRAEINGAPRA